MLGQARLAHPHSNDRHVMRKGRGSCRRHPLATEAVKQVNFVSTPVYTEHMTAFYGHRMNDEKHPQRHVLLPQDAAPMHAPSDRATSRRDATSCNSVCQSVARLEVSASSSPAAVVACTASVVTTNHVSSLHNASSRRSWSSKTSATLMVCLSALKTTLTRLSRCRRYHLPPFAGCSDWADLSRAGVESARV
jgi:hypothetical protein